MSSFGSGLPIVAPAPATPVVGPQGSNPIVVLPVPGPAGTVDLAVDENDRYILDGGGPANGTGA